MDQMADYYRQRAATYEEIYFRPDERRLFEQEEIARAIRSWLRDRQVLEVAAGTGFWTVHAAATSRRVVATDVNQEVLEIARTKPLEQVEFQLADAYALSEIPGEFNGALSCCWLSHVPKSRLQSFLSGLHERIGPGSRVLMADNVFVPGIGGELLKGDGEDSYKLRDLPDGTQHRVLKNYFSEAELRALLADCRQLSVTIGERFWWVTYETPPLEPV